MIAVDLAQFVAAVHAYAPKWKAGAIQWQLTLGPKRDKSAAWVNCETGDLGGTLIVWTSGEAELEAGNIATGIIDRVHYDLASPEELSACLDDLTHRPTEQT